MYINFYRNKLIKVNKLTSMTKIKRMKISLEKEGFYLSCVIEVAR